MSVLVVLGTVAFLTAYAFVWALCAAAKQNDRPINPPERNRRDDQ